MFFDLYSPVGNLTISVVLFLRWWTIVKVLEVSQSKAFFISFASPDLFFYATVVYIIVTWLLD